MKHSVAKFLSEVDDWEPEFQEEVYRAFETFLSHAPKTPEYWLRIGEVIESLRSARMMWRVNKTLQG